MQKCKKKNTDSCKFCLFSFFKKMTTPEGYFELRKKLVCYQFERSSKRLQVNLCIKQDKEIRIVLCFPAEDWHLISKEREIFEYLVEKFLSPDGWYLKPKYKITSVQKPFDHDTITKLTMKRIIDS